MKALVVSSELAAICEVDLKTIHNWVDRGRISAFRSPGGHLRFKREDVAAFLAKYGYPVPASLADVVPAAPAPSASTDLAPVLTVLERHGMKATHPVTTIAELAAHLDRKLDEIDKEIVTMTLNLDEARDALRDIAKDGAR